MLFVCLAKSKKHGERCVAGVEVESSGTGFAVVRDGTEPHWIRPIAETEHGEVPTALVDKIKLLDVVEFPGLVPAPEGFQSENYEFGSGTPRVVGSIPRSHAELAKFETARSGTLFSNRGKAIPAEKIHLLDYSLLLLRADDVTFHRNPTLHKQIRAEFNWGGTQYDLPVTDPEFERAFENAPPDGPSFASCYLTLSVGVEHNEWHNKLVAGVFLL
jgi:hypothetical protein